jgi:hypothetical protein
MRACVSLRLRVGSAGLQLRASRTQRTDLRAASLPRRPSRPPSTASSGRTHCPSAGHAHRTSRIAHRPPRGQSHSRRAPADSFRHTFAAMLVSCEEAGLVRRPRNSDTSRPVDITGHFGTVYSRNSAHFDNLRGTWLTWPRPAGGEPAPHRGAGTRAAGRRSVRRRAVPAGAFSLCGAQRTRFAKKRAAKIPARTTRSGQPRRGQRARAWRRAPGTRVRGAICTAVFFSSAAWCP